MASDFERVARRLDGYREVAIDLARRLCAIPALDPASGGDGEAKKAELVLELLSEQGLTEVAQYRAPDPRVSAGYRPNLVARLPGRDRSRALFIMSHLDVVPAGDLKHWQSDPFTLRVEGSKLYARGVEDNGQGLVSSLCLLRALREEAVLPPRDLALLFVADEETGNQHGIGYLLEHAAIFGAEDLIVVPDGGEPDGSMIEVAEKSILWVKVAVAGKQTHGSTPDRGVNAHSAAARLICALEELRQRFDRKDLVFDPPVSTFEPTKLEPGVENVNTIPGEHTFYLDCRVMPGYDLEEVLAFIRERAAAIDAAQGTRTEVSAVQRQDAAPPTSVDAAVVHALRRAVKAVYGVEARAMGIGGGTVAAQIRRKGFPAAVWARMDETMHGPNEYAVLENLLGDAKVFAHVLCEG
jgi:succinyl-diaminopimelate desuccinylase